MIKWLDDIKVGDKVIVHSGFRSIPPLVKTAKKVSKHHIILDEPGTTPTKFQIRTGRPVGSYSSFCRTIEAWTEERWEELEEIEREHQEFQQREKLIQKISNELHHTTPSLEQLQQICQILDMKELI